MEYEEYNDSIAYNQRADFQPKILRKPGVTILNEILSTIKLDAALIEENNSILQEFLSTFLEEMKKDKLFKEVFQRVHYTGSFYSDLRISEPNEFDINVILKMPFKLGDFEIVYSSQVPSYAKYQLKNEQRYAVSHDKLLKNFFENGFLLHEKVRRWMQSVVDKALWSYTRPQRVIGIVPSASGPARTLQLKKRQGIIDIDLVPVISCCLETKQSGIDHRVYQKLGTPLEAFLVPKPYCHPKQAPVSAPEIQRLWRTHFPGAENKLIHNIGCVKPVIKLLKLLRDKEDWKILASYYLKTVVMWMLVENSDREKWRTDKIDERLIEALEKLRGYVSAEKLPYLFSNKLNLISKMNENQALNISNRLSVIIRDVQNDPKKFWKIFKIEPTFSY